MKRVFISEHARFEMSRRRIPEEMVLATATAPHQVLPSTKGRKVYQSRITEATTRRQFLLRLVVEEKDDMILVVTAYKTSKLDKYWQKEGE